MPHIADPNDPQARVPKTRGRRSRAAQAPAPKATAENPRVPKLRTHTASGQGRVNAPCISEHRLAPTDFWFLACADYADAERSITHRHVVGFVEVAESIWPKVYVLTEHRFDDN